MSDAPTMVDVIIDDVHVSVPKGTLVIRAAEQAGIRIPRFCDHPLLEPVAACRQCLVEVGMPDRNTGELRFMPKPQPSCAQTVAPGMVVKTQHTSGVADTAQRGVMEFLLINHPLDCPVCDKGGECPLQNQAMTEGRGKSRFADAKRTFKKPLRITSQILLDRERCILCQRCVRFGKEISGDVFIDLQGRGGGTAPTDDHYFMGEQIGGFDTTTLGFFDPAAKDNSAPDLSGPYGTDAIAGSFNEGDLGPAGLDQSGRAFASYFSGNIIQICPVGALTAASYRFRARPFDLVSTASVSEHDASGSAVRQDIRRGVVVRRMAGNDPEVNEEWITDKDRFAFEWDGQDRLRTPLVREDGELVPTSWSDALDRARKGLEAAPSAGFLPGGRLTFEDAWAWSKFARTVLGSDNIDFRSREATEEERSFLASTVAGTGLGVTYSDLERAGQVLLVALEPEDECGALFLRLRKGVRRGGARVATVAPYTSTGSQKLSATVLRSAPGTEPAVVDSIAPGGQNAALFGALSGGVILVGERAARRQRAQQGEFSHTSTTLTMRRLPAWTIPLKPRASLKSRLATRSPSTLTAPPSTMRKPSDVLPTSPAAFKTCAIPSAPSGASMRHSSRSSGISFLAKRLTNASCAAAAAASSWKRATSSRASSNFTSRGLRPAVTSACSAAISSMERKESRVNQRHISSSEIDIILPNISFAGSKIPM